MLGCVRDVGSDSDFRRGGPPFGLGRLTANKRVWEVGPIHFSLSSRDGRGLIKRRRRNATLYSLIFNLSINY